MAPRVLATATAFVLFSQILVYEALARKTGRLVATDLTSVRSWTELQDIHFAKVRGTEHDWLFAFPMARLLEDEDNTRLLRRIVEEVRGLVPLLSNNDLLGKAYHELVPMALRKHLGAFYTNDAAAGLLARLAVSSKAARVVDPACGSGTLLLAACSRLRELHGPSKGGKPQKQGFLNQLTGIDVMPFAVCLAAVNLLLQEPEDQTGSVRLGVADSTRLQPDSVVLDWQGKARFTLGHHDVVLMNPPFTRGHILTPRDKLRLEADFSAFRTYLGGLAGLQGYFLLLAHTLLNEGGYLGAVLPASTFGTRSNEGLTQFLLSHFAVDFVILCRQRSAFSEQTNLRELLILARKQTPPDTHEVTFVVVNKSPAHWSTEDIERFHVTLSNGASAEPAAPTRASDLLMRRVVQASLSPQPRLFYRNLLQTSSSLLSVYQMIRELAEKTELQPFPAVLRRLNVQYLLNPRGSFALGFKALNLLPNVEACLKTNDVWFIAERRAGTLRVRNRITNDTVDLRMTETIPCVRRLAGLTTIDSSDAIGCTLSRVLTPAAERLVTGTFRRSEATEYLRILRTRWQTRVAKTKTHLIMTYKADLGAPGAHLLAAVFDAAAYPAGDAWVFPSLALEQARILALWMNSTFFLVDLLVNRTEQRGSWMRFDKPVLDQLLLPDPTMLSQTQRQQLLHLYAKVHLVSLPSFLSRTLQRSRRIIDERLLQILGMKGESASALATKSASAAQETVSDLARMMQGD
jgi:tRNA1(Val) A37 N6-methylase TrmN6